MALPLPLLSHSRLVLTRDAVLQPLPRITFHPRPSTPLCSLSQIHPFHLPPPVQVSSWRQCKRLLKVLNENHEAIKAIEAKLCTGAPLTPYEQAVYDGNSGVAEDKIAWLQVCVCGWWGGRAG